MIGERAYRYALERRHNLKEELEEVERFIAVCERYAAAGDHKNTEPASLAQSRESTTEVPRGRALASVKLFVDICEIRRRWRKEGGSPI